MQKGSLENWSPMLQLLLVVAIAVGSMILFMFLSLIPLFIFQGVDETLLSYTENSGVLRYMQIVQSIAVFIVPPLIAAYLFSQKPKNYLGLVNPKIILIFLAIVLFFISLPLISLLANVNNSLVFPEFLQSFEHKLRVMEEANNNLVFKLLETNNPIIILVNVFMIVIVPAFGEELFFRGTLQPLTCKIVKNNHIAVWLTAFIFAAIHLQFFTFLPRFILGALLGYLFLYGKNIWYSIAGHSVNNLSSLVVFYYYRHFKPDINPMNPDVDDFGWLINTVSIVLIAMLFYCFYKYRKNSD